MRNYFFLSNVFIHYLTRLFQKSTLGQHGLDDKGHSLKHCIVYLTAVTWFKLGLICLDIIKMKNPNMNESQINCFEPEENKYLLC